MHILILPSSFPDGYHPFSGIFFKHQAEALAASGIKVGVVAPDIRRIRDLINSKLYSMLSREYDYYLNETVPVIRKIGVNILPITSIWNQFLFNNYSQKLFKKYCNRFGSPDLVHAHVATWAGYAGVCISRMHGIPLIITEHSSGFGRELFSSREKKILINTYSHAKLIITVSNYLKKHVEQYAQSKEIRVIPNIVNTQYFKYSGHAKNKNLLFAVGTLNANKGFDILIRAFAKAVRLRPELHLRIGGEGPEKNKLLRLVRERGMEKHISLIGLLNREEVHKNLMQTGIFALTSYVETFGVVLIEAMAMGIPVIATKCGGPEELVNPKNGILCDVGDVEAVEKAILTLTDNYSQYNSQIISEGIANDFDQQKIVAEIIGCYEKVISLSKHNIKFK